jgi:hypothetical protein
VWGPEFKCQYCQQKNKINTLYYREKTLGDIGIGNNFLNKILIAQQIRSRINKWDRIQLKKLLYSKGNITSIKKQLMQWEKILASYSTDKD